MEDIPNSIIAEKMKKYMRMITQQRDQSRLQPTEDPEKFVLSKASDDRALELLEKLKLVHPDVYRALIQELYKLLKSGVLREIDGLTVYSIIRRLGLDIKPELRIRFVKHGKEVDFKEYVGD